MKLYNPIFKTGLYEYVDSLTSWVTHKNQCTMIMDLEEDSICSDYKYRTVFKRYLL